MSLEGGRRTGDARTSLLVATAGALALAGCSGSTSGPASVPAVDQVSTSAPEPLFMPTDATDEGEMDSSGFVDSAGDEPDDGYLTDESPPEGDAPPEDSYSDDFSSDTLANWTLRHQEAGEAPQYTLLDIDRTRPGALTIEPLRTPGWFADGTAPLVFKRVSGDFSVEVDVLAESASILGEPPGADFNSAGLMARDPASGGGTENYVMVNLGRQNGGSTPVVGTESKTTRNSISVLDIQTGTNRGKLILCRTGSSFQSYRLLDNETEWRRIGTVQRPDLPNSLQVGMVANGFEGPDLRATFFEISLRVPQSSEDCTPR